MDDTRHDSHGEHLRPAPSRHDLGPAAVAAPPLLLAGADEDDITPVHIVRGID
ncbi:surface protein [Streptomyces sp. NPDC048523]|uniref:surface protein n=1 Tax=unclassified Streptomyces TaxID=2593676 RepID=UPI0033286630